MDNMNACGREAGLVRLLDRSQRRIMARAASVVMLLAPLALGAADSRTVLKPGWNMFSPQQDVEVGQQASMDAEKQLPMLKDSRVDNYVNSLGRRLSTKAPGEKYPYEFKAVNDGSINAFAFPGGPVYINRGVIEAVDNEAQLAGVIAHEISHVALRHGTNQASKASAAQLPLAILGGILSSDSTGAALAELGANFALNSVLLKYSRTAESQADIMGAQILYDSGYDPRAMAQFFQKIETQQEGSGPVEFFSNHPSPDNRIDNVNQEVNALGGVRRDFHPDSREFGDIKRYLQSLPAERGQQPLTSGQSGANPLRIVSAIYGADNTFIDVHQRIQALVQNDRLNLEVTNSSMGGDPLIGTSKTLQLRYQWDNRSYDVIVQENQRLSIPTREQISDANDRDSGNGSTVDTRPERFVRAENSLMSIDHPASWQTYGQGDAMTITPRDGMVTDANGNRSLAYGVILSVFEPRADTYSRQLQGPRYEQGSVQDAAARVEQSTNQLVQELRLSNRSMRVIRYGEAIRVDGARGLSTYLSNDSPLGGRETNWLVTMERSGGLIFLIFTSPEHDFQKAEAVFHHMLRSFHIKQ